MSKLLVVGMGPLLEEGVRNFAAPCLRTWYFVKPLLTDGHTVRLVTLPIYDPDDPNRHKAALVRRTCEGLDYQAFTNTDFDFILPTLTNVARSLEPDAIVAVNNLPAWVASRLPMRTPLWADLNGWEIAEKQGQAARLQDDAPLEEAWRRESTVARRADKFSAVSHTQIYALLGELGAVGRLNRHTFHYHFAHHFPNASHEFFLRPPDLKRKPILRGSKIPDKAFVLLWSGGYNYWTDPRFLFRFLDATMRANPNVHFVSTGGRIAGYNAQTYEEFEALVLASPHRERCHFLGWTPAEDLPQIYSECDMGLNIDEPNYETFFGARNRINNFLAAGVPVITTQGSEISREIAAAACGVVCPPGSVEALVDAALSMASASDQLLKMSERARAYALEQCAADAIVAPMRAWAQRPALAPDNADKQERFPHAASFLETPGNTLENFARIAAAEHLPTLVQAHADLTAIRARLSWRVLKRLKVLARGAIAVARHFAPRRKPPTDGATSQKN